MLNKYNRMSTSTLPYIEARNQSYSMCYKMALSLSATTRARFLVIVGPYQRTNHLPRVLSPCVVNAPTRLPFGERPAIIRCPSV